MFWLQLRLLLWKNFTIRRRQKVRVIVELLWPLILFLILVWVRTRELKDNYHQCHFQEKALPSAGGLRFLRDFLCGYNNTCYQDPVTDAEPELDSAWAEEFFSDLETILQKRVREKEIQSVQNLGTDALTVAAWFAQKTESDKSKTGTVPLASLLVNRTTLEERLRNSNVTFSDAFMDRLYGARFDTSRLSFKMIKQFKADPLSLVCDSDGNSVITHPVSKQQPILLEEICNIMRKYNFGQWESYKDWVKENIKLSDLMTDQSEALATPLHVLDAVVVMNSLKDIADDLTVAASVKKAIEKLNESPSFRRQLELWEAKPEVQLPESAVMLNFLYELSCGRKFIGLFSDDLETINSQNTAGLNDEKLRSKVEHELLHRFDHLKKAYNYNKDNTTSDECNDILQSLENNFFTQMLWGQVKPLLRGKIVYYPDTPATAAVMKQVNETFAQFLNIQEAATTWASQISPMIRGWAKNTVLLNPNFTKELNEESIRQVVTQLQVMLPEKFSEEVLQFYQNAVANNHLSSSVVENLLDTVDSFASSVTQYIGCFEFNKIEGFMNEKEALDYGTKLMHTNKLWAAVIFHNLPDDWDGNELPPFVEYKIRMHPDRVDNTRYLTDKLPRPGPRRRPHIDMKYFQNGYIYLQDILESAVIKIQTGREDLPGLIMQQFPYPCYIVDRFFIAISRTFPLFMILSWVYTASMLIKSIVHEKETRLKETLRMMGMGSGVHWAAWFIDALIPMALTCVMLTGLLVGGKILEKSDPTLVFAFLMCFCIATISKCFLVSTFFSRANIASAAGGMVFFLMHLPFPFMMIWEEYIRAGHKLAASFISNVAFGFGCSYFAYWEEAGTGGQWSIAATSPMFGDYYSIMTSMGMMLLDGVIYGIMAWYVERVNPGQFGIAKPWYFPLQKSYWFGPRKDDLKQVPQADPARSDIFETEPSNASVGVAVRRLTKVYRNGKKAVEDLSLNFYEGQITSFLGHNGAGKTTTISILTGLFPPTSGTAYINGLDIRTEMDEIRKNLGMCPQYNILISQLTVAEHLWFFARLKGKSNKDVKVEVEQFLEDLVLTPKRNTDVDKLSGGMQRKLSIGIAFIGGSKTVILDEPTAGVDPYSRRAIWEILLKYRGGRTVILTTHFMDEADLLGDRIAILARGRLRTCGSSMFLKQRFGSGYYLTLVKQPLDYSKMADTDSAAKLTYEDPDATKRITSFVRQWIPSASLQEDVGSDVVYCLPLTTSDQKKLMEPFLQSLDRALPELGISSYGVSDTTLEEIFLRVADEEATHEEAVAKVNYAMDESLPSWRQTTNQRLLRSRNSLTVADITQHYATGSESVSVEFHTPSCDVTCTDLNCRHIARLGHAPHVIRGAYMSVNMYEEDLLQLPRLRGRALVCQQFKAMLRKRFLHAKRNKKGIFAEIVLPACFVFVAMLITFFIPPPVPGPELVLSPWLYGESAAIPFEVKPSNSTWPEEYLNHLKGGIGLGAKCTQANPYKMECRAQSYDIPASESFDKHAKYPECTCDYGAQLCAAGASGPTPDTFIGVTQDEYSDVSDRDMATWILRSFRQYRSSRYGAYQFGVPAPAANVNLSYTWEILNRMSKATNLGQPRPVPFQDVAEMLVGQAQKSGRADNIRVWYNNKGWAASVSYLNAINNVILRTSLPPHKQALASKFGIKASNHPMAMVERQKDERIMYETNIVTLHAICVIFALSFVPASILVFLVEERTTKARHLQFVSGVKPYLFWISNYVWDMLSYMVPCTLCLLIFLGFKQEAYVSPTNFPGLVCIMFLYGFSCIPLMYPASFVFQIPSSGFVTLASVNIIIGMVTTISTFILELFSDPHLKLINSVLKQVFLIFPQYCLGRGLLELASQHMLELSLQRFGIKHDRSPFEWEFLGRNIFCMTVEGIIFFGITLIVQYRCGCFKKKASSQAPLVFGELGSEDEDVSRERRRVETGAAEEDVLRLWRLTKVYPKNKVPAVDRLSMGVVKGECFGLLGVNGAGKSTTFKMLTGDEDVSGGSASVAGYDLITQLEHVRQNLGYCPQVDAILPLLTGREHLEFFALLRGIHPTYTKLVAQDCLKQLGLSVYAERLSGTYSGGNKRKLSTAIALIGEPSIIFLDEPTSGMDPGARRALWGAVLGAVKRGRSVVLTSHSMEECQVLCGRLAIMVNGRFKCLGSPQHLKNRFGDGYMITVRCNNEDLGLVNMVQHLRSMLPQAELREQRHHQIVLQVAQDALPLSTLFRIMENARECLPIDDYSVSQTTLDEVFVRFASMQREVASEDSLPLSVKVGEGVSPKEKIV